jgi:chromosome segregation ATPase
MPKKQPTITDERPLEAESVQELSRIEVIAQMRRNAESRIAEIQADRQGLEQLLEDKAHQKGLLLEQQSEAEDHHQSMLAEQEEAAGRVTRENSRLQIAKGTGAEGEHEAILQSLIADLDQAKQRVESAGKARDEANERATIVPALDNAIAEIHSQIADLAREQAEMEDLRDEQHREYGVALAEEIQEGIETTRQAVIAQEEALAESKRQFEAAQRRVSELSEWKIPIKTYWPQAERELSPTGHILEAYIAYLRALIKYGSRAKEWINRHQRLVDVLDLNPNATRAMMAPGRYRQVVAKDFLGREHTKEVPTHQRVEIAEEILSNER